MTHKAKITGSEKIEAIEKYLRGEDSLNHLATLLDVSFTTIRQWLQTYQSLGPNGLLNTSKHTAKVGRDRKEAFLSQVRYETIYLAIRDLNKTKLYPIRELCEIMGIQRSSYYKEHHMNVNHKSVWCRKRKHYIKSTPEITAKNVLNREFQSNEFGTKWITDVTKLKYSIQSKAYLSAILDLADKSIVSFVLGHSNNTGNSLKDQQHKK